MRILVCTFVISAVPAGAAPRTAVGQTPSGVVATVNGEAIGRAEFDKDWAAFMAQERRVLKPEQMTPQWERSRRQMLLDQMIERRLLLQEAQRRKIAVLKEELDMALRRVKSNFTDEGFQAQLAKEGLTERQFEENIKDQLRAAALTNSIVKERVRPPTEQEVRKLFDSVKERLGKPAKGAPAPGSKEAEIEFLAREFRLRSAERARFQHILFQVKAGASEAERQAVLKKARGVKAKLDKGADFADMAKEYSDDAVTRARGGEAGYIARGEIQDLDQAIFSLPVGGVSGVVKSRLGYHLIRIEEKRAASPVRYEDVKNALGDFLMRKAASEELARFVGGLRKAASIAQSWPGGKETSPGPGLVK